MTVEIQEPKKAGRPSEFSQETVTAICERMAEGETLRKICSDPEMPSRNTVLRWVKNDDGFKRQYENARQACMDWYADEIVNIAWDTSNDTVQGNSGQPLCNHEWIARSRLKVDSLKFLMAKLHPTRYGDKVQPDHPEQMNVNTGVPRLTVSWVRHTVDPIHDDDGSVINADDSAKLRARIAVLEERLGIRGGKPPKQITYDPGPLPRAIDPEVVARFLRMIKATVPQADQRPPETVLDEVISECESALKAKYVTNGEVSSDAAT